MYQCLFPSLKSITMDSRVYLNKTPLTILSIPRARTWLFAAPILELLSAQAALADPEGTASYLSSLESDYDSDSEDSILLQRQDSEDPLMASIISSGLNSIAGMRKTPLVRLSSQTDNSSKQDPRYLSPRGSVTDLSLSKTITTEEDDEEQEAEESFFHIAYTPLECTIICCSPVFEKLFRKPLAVSIKLAYDDVVIVDNQFFSLQVDNEGQDNGSARILEFTQPLSEMKISLFFLSSHFSDIVLIPQSYRDQVVEILAQKHFIFSPNTNSYMVDFTKTNKSTAPPSDELTDLIKDTRRLFNDAKIRPRIHKSKRCLLTGARPGEVKNSIEKASACIAAGKIPDYFAITRTAVDEISLILPGSSKKRYLLGFDSRSIVGLSLDAIIPITVDLSKLPLDSTGIVAGLASSLLESMKDTPESGDLGTLEMNYLSMARSAIIMIPEENLTVVTEMVNQMSLQ